jgi:type IV secretion system protein VirD4
MNQESIPRFLIFAKFRNQFIGIIFWIFSNLASFWRWLRGIFRGKVHGHARFMNRYEMSRFLNPFINQGLIFSRQHRLALCESFKNLCLTCPTGGGKTTRYIIPNLLNLDAKSSAVVTDPSGEIFERTSGHLQERGFCIQVLNPSNLAQSQYFNPLLFFRSAQELKHLAITISQHNTGTDTFWQSSAANILHICLSALSNIQDQELNHLGNVRFLLNHLGLEISEVKNFMARYLNDVMFTEYKAFVAQDQKVIANILSTARAALDLWSDADVVRFTSKNSIEIKNLRRKPTVTYLIIPEEKVRYFSLLINFFYSACFEYCLKNYGAGYLPVFFFMEEFGNLGRINNFASIATTLRKRQCSISIVLQDLAQLKAIYGQHDAASIFSGGMNNKLFFSGLDLETCAYLERVLGNNTAYDVVYGDFSENARTVAKPLLSVDEIRMLPQDKAILISGHHKPIKFAMPAYFENAEFNKLSQKKPFVFSGEGQREEVRFLQFDNIAKNTNQSC